MRMQTELLLFVLWQLYIVSTAGTTETAVVKSRRKLECKHGLQSVDIITWKKDNTQIAYKSKTESNIEREYELEEGVEVSYLVIKETRTEDAGVYTCNAYISQPKRHESLTIQLEVKAGGNIVNHSLLAMFFGFVVHKMFV